MPRTPDKKTEMRVYLTEKKHPDIIAWMQQQGNISEAVICLIREHLTLSENATLQEMKQILQRLDARMQSGGIINATQSDAQDARPDATDHDPELLDALDALG